MTHPLAIQSWCFRKFKPLPAFFEQLKAAGCNATELCGVHADFSNPATFEPTLNAFKSAGVSIVCIGVQTLSGDREKDRPYFEFCKRAKVRNMSVTFSPRRFFDGLSPIEKLAEEYDVTLGIHNHGSYDWLGNATMLQFVFERCSPRIGLHMDTAWALDATQDPCEWAERFAGRIFGIHVKDFIFDRAGKPQDVVIGTGNLQLPRLMGILKETGFAGPVVIEYEGDEDNPAPALTKCVQAIAPLL